MTYLGLFGLDSFSPLTKTKETIQLLNWEEKRKEIYIFRLNIL